MVTVSKLWASRQKAVSLPQAVLECRGELCHCKDKNQLQSRMTDSASSTPTRPAFFMTTCRQLRSVDLFGTSLQNIGRIFAKPRSFEHLSSLVLPQSARFGREPQMEIIDWPPNLRHITINGIFDFRDSLWPRETFASKWPPSLQTVVLSECLAAAQPGDWTQVVNTPHRLDSVRISIRNWLRYGEDMVSCCSGARHLSLPVEYAGIRYDTYGNRPRSRLEQLEIHPGCTGPIGPHMFQPSDLVAHVRAIPTLLRIRVHRSLMGDGRQPIETADRLLRDRASIKSQEVGVAVVKPKGCGVFLFED
jgi:hypothetical protein